MIRITDVQKVSCSIAPVDAKGNPGQIDGAATWSTSDASIANVSPALDGLSCVIVAAGKLGTAQIVVSADADLGAGVQNITGTLDVEVVGSAATSISITPGVPEAA